MIDVRCASTCGSASVENRCQLYAGHVGPHVLLTHDELGLVLRSWGRDGEHADETVAAHTPLPYPWAPSCPQVVTADPGDRPCDTVGVA